MQETLYNVTRTSELTGMHPQTLRHYEKIRLLIPRRTLGGVRRYTEWDILKLNTIRELSNKGVNLEGIAIILQLNEENSILKHQLEVARNDSPFYSGKNGVFIDKNIRKFSLKERLKFFKMLNPKRSAIKYQPLMIENK